MKTKTLPKTFRRGDFDWELIKRKIVLGYTKNLAGVETKKFGLYKQDATHWVVCRIMDREPHPESRAAELWDHVECIPTDRMWGELANTYDTLEEAQKEYEIK